MYGARAQTIRDRVATIEEACTVSATSTVLPLSTGIKIEPKGGDRQHVDIIDAMLLLPVTETVSTLSLVPLVDHFMPEEGPCTPLSAHPFVSFTQQTF